MEKTNPKGDVAVLGRASPCCSGQMELCGSELINYRSNKVALDSFIQV